MSSAHPFWGAVFDDPAPVEIEIGSGDGTFLLGAAVRHPGTNFLGIERSRAKARRLAARVARAGAPHVRTLHADATCVVTTVLPDASVSAYHVYFPDPWPKHRHAARRLFTAEMIAGIARTLVLDGRLLIATDVYGYMCVIRARILADGRFADLELAGEHPGLGTAFAAKYRAAGRPLYTAAFTRLRRLPA